MMYSSDDQSGLVKVLTLLKSHDGEYLSGQDLSDVLKMSRVAVWKQIKKLGDLGYAIQSSPKLGYKLESHTDLPLPWEITAGLSTDMLGRHAYYTESTESTQSLAGKMARDNAVDGTVIVAGIQTAGRGRNGRRWISPPGGIWLSIILCPRFDASAVTFFPMAASLALYRAIAKKAKVKTEIKWPNDLTIDGRKVAGMVVDASIESSRLENIILGVGINYNIDARYVNDALRGTENFYGATSVVKNGGAGATALIQEFLVQLETVCHELDRGNAGKLAADWTAASSTIGRSISIRAAGKTISGRATGIDSDGALLVARGGKTTRVLAGDVIHK